MTSRSARSIAAIGLTLACFAPAPSAAVSKVAPVCRELANAFFIIATYEARGDSKESQLVWLREEYAPNEASSPLGIFDRALDYVYGSDESAKEIRASVMDHCVVDEHGRAVLRLPDL
jgi:hypothetical protein